MCGVVLSPVFVGILYPPRPDIIEIGAVVFTTIQDKSCDFYIQMMMMIVKMIMDYDDSDDDIMVRMMIVVIMIVKMIVMMMIVVIVIVMMMLLLVMHKYKDDEWIYGIVSA